MAGGCLSSFFKYISVLLVGVCLHDVEAARCQHVINKKVGDTVEFSSCLPTEGVTVALWEYGGLLIADKDGDVPENPQFKGRVDLNPTNFSLTVRRLTLQDSGDFQFVSDGNDKQRDTVTITLQVHEPITKEPNIISSYKWHDLNESCTFLLECNATTDSNVSYNWTVRNQTINGSRLQYIIERQDEDTEFTCTISNFVSEMSTIKTVECNNITSVATPIDPNLIVYLSAAGGGLFLIIVVIVGVVVCVCRRKQSQEGSDSNDLTVYADITEVAIEDRTSSTMKNCTLYETIDKRVEAVAPGPQTVYDEIRLSRLRKASVSPYQDVS
ncbi:uncharacterized protein LOC141760182 [Sebastes fasciatus]|uniref:uncharacterized protein LOC141760182 n=1 Tax=Sebastes fasciatus TaxID=394691 RepID=UPI003D9F0F3B